MNRQRGARDKNEENKKKHTENNHTNEWLQYQLESSRNRYYELLNRYCYRFMFHMFIWINYYKEERKLEAIL